MGEWLTFWRRSIREAAHFGRSLIEKALVIAGVVAFFGITIGVFRFSAVGILVAALGLLLVLCQGAFRTWKADKELGELAAAERDVMLAERETSRPLHPEHIETLKETLQYVTLCVRQRIAVSYGEGEPEKLAAFRDAFGVHYSKFQSQVAKWQNLISDREQFTAAVQKRFESEHVHLVDLGFDYFLSRTRLGQAVNRSDKDQPPLENTWNSAHIMWTYAPGSTELLPADLGRNDRRKAKTALDEVLSSIPEWPELIQRQNALLDLEKLRATFLPALVEAEVRPLTHDVKKCRTCPD